MLSGKTTSPPPKNKTRGYRLGLKDDIKIDAIKYIIKI
jgi:hypothetical protein